MLSSSLFNSLPTEPKTTMRTHILLLLATLLISLLHIAAFRPESQPPTTPDTSVCTNTKYPKVCQDTVEGADSTYDAYSTLTAHINALVEMTEKLLDEATTAIDDKEVKEGEEAKAVGNCKKHYGEAVQLLEDTKTAHKLLDNVTVKKNLESIIQLFEACEHEFAEVPGGDPYANDDSSAVMLAENCISLLEIA